jgi:GntR family transcriptional regulator
MTDAQRLVVDLVDGTPPFEQIRRQVVAHVASGLLSPGDRLPTIRALATDLGLAAGTVARAYKELEADGVVVTQRRAGTVVASTALSADIAVRRAAAVLVVTAREVGLSDEEVITSVRGALIAPPTGTREAHVEGSEPVENP